MSQDSDICLRTFCADLSSPQISAILVGHCTTTNTLSTNICSSPQDFQNDNCADKYQSPASQNSIHASPRFGRPCAGRLRSGCLVCFIARHAQPTYALIQAPAISFSSNILHLLAEDLVEILFERGDNSGKPDPGRPLPGES